MAKRRVLVDRASQRLKPSKWTMATWPRRWDSSGKALKAHGRVWCPGGPCVAAVLKPSKWTLVAALGKQWQSKAKDPWQGLAGTWEGSGKALKVKPKLDTCGDPGRRQG